MQINKSFSTRFLRTSAALACIAAAGGAFAQGAASGASSGAANLSSTDRTFVQKAAMGGMAEVEAGQLAQDKSTTDAVKQYGSKMVADHGKANDELKQIATGKGMTVPAATDAEHQKAKARMSAMAGTQFDRAFKAQMVADHQKTIALFQRESSAGKDADLKAFATKTLPDLKDHLKMAQAL